MENVEFMLLLSYIEIEYWYFHVDNILNTHNCDPNHYEDVKNHILSELQRFKYIQINPISLNENDSELNLLKCSIDNDYRNNINMNNKYCRYLLYDDIKHNSGLTSYEASNILLHSNIMSQSTASSSSSSCIFDDYYDNPMFFIPLSKGKSQANQANQGNKVLSAAPELESNPLVDMNGLYAEYKTKYRSDLVGHHSNSGDIGMGMGSGSADGNNKHKSTVPWNRVSEIPSFIRNNGLRRVLIYQSRGVFTGGTDALEDVYKSLVRLGYDRNTVVMCNDDNYDSRECSAAAITGMLV